MANTTVCNGKTINITFDGTTDWSWDSTTEITAAPSLGDLSALKGLFVDSIEFRPNATDDVCIIREGSLTGPKIFDVKCANAYDVKSKYFAEGVRLSGLYATGADVVGTGSVIIILR